MHQVMDLYSIMMRQVNINSFLRPIIKYPLPYPVWTERFQALRWMSSSTINFFQTPCMSNPCQHGAAFCRPIYNRDDYECVCKPGFTGKYRGVGQYSFVKCSLLNALCYFFRSALSECSRYAKRTHLWKGQTKLCQLLI